MSPTLKQVRDANNREFDRMSGKNRLWSWFGISRSSWLTLPRVLMHEMPDDWQRDMAKLLEQWDSTWDSSMMPSPYVSARSSSAGNRWVPWPKWLLNYRHPDHSYIGMMRLEPAVSRQESTTRRWTLSSDMKTLFPFLVDAARRRFHL